MLTFALDQILAPESDRTIRCKGTHRIYIIVDDDGFILYAGQSSNVRARVREHYRDQKSEIGRVMHEFLPRSLKWTVHFLTLDDCRVYADQMAAVLGHWTLYKNPVDQAEHTVIWCLKPIFNKMLNKH